MSTVLITRQSRAHRVLRAFGAIGLCAAFLAACAQQPSPVGRWSADAMPTVKSHMAIEPDGTYSVRFVRAGQTVYEGDGTWQLLEDGGYRFTSGADSTNSIVGRFNDDGQLIVDTPQGELQYGKAE